MINQKLDEILWDLMGTLKQMGIEKEDAVGVGLLMKTEKQANEMMAWLKEVNYKATASDVIGKAARIAHPERF